MLVSLLDVSVWRDRPWVRSSLKSDVEGPSMLVMVPWASEFLACGNVA